MSNPETRPRHCETCHRPLPHTDAESRACPETRPAAVSITLDRTAQMMLSLLKETIAEEPEQANENMPSGLFLETARKHDEWDRHVDACYLMLNARLRALVEDQLL